ncbi:MAG: bifunctional phosphoribosyl-AMP cyclohydrolase/phosphoribosyl-ATP diphosphatase HisIE [Deltaproteobacteria bacterium]|nr:bifunctional phosphoribosyl-AMP cyclohydrolase/phosphoribosyl-ATP diphosphatase HisIE [Deltaproteobacteria bacterium]
MKIDFEKAGGLVPAIVQDHRTRAVLMLGYMNEEALQRTRADGVVTFFSRSKGRLWVKGETSGNFLKVIEVLSDCDSDTILIKAQPAGPVCHTGQATCFEDKNESGLFLARLEELLLKRKETLPSGSYSAELFKAGLSRIAQKVGEEAVEVVIAAVDRRRDAIIGEASDLIYHLMALLIESGVSFQEIIGELERRHAQKPGSKEQ